MKSLTQSCLERIVKSIRSGDVVDLSSTTPKLRQLVLDAYLEHDDKYYFCGETAPSTFSDVGFLDNMPCLDMRKGTADDGNLLNGFIKSITEMESAVDNLTELRLNLYVLRRYSSDESDMSSNISYDSFDRSIDDLLRNLGMIFAVANYQQVVMLIRKCSMVNSLTLRFVRTYSLKCSYENSDTDTDCKHRHLENFDTPEKCFNEIVQQPHVQRLQKLEVVREKRMNEIYNQYDSLCFLHFVRQLTLEECSFLFNDWVKFLENCRETLEVVLLNNVSVWGTEVLPIPLPKLQRFRAVSSDIVCTDTFVKNIQLCPHLQRLSFSLNGSERVDAVLSLSKLPILEDLFVHLNDNADSVNKISTMFSDYIESVRMEYTRVFGERSIEAIRAFVSTCTNLKSIDLSDVDDNVAAEFVPIFTDKSRAEKLVNVKLRGDFPQLLIDSLFRNCTNLDTVKIYDCPQAKDKSVDDMVAKPQIFICEMSHYDDDDVSFGSYDDYGARDGVDSDYYYGSD